MYIKIIYNAVVELKYVGEPDQHPFFLAQKTWALHAAQRDFVGLLQGHMDGHVLELLSHHIVHGEA